MRVSPEGYTSLACAPDSFLLLERAFPTYHWKISSPNSPIPPLEKHTDALPKQSGVVTELHEPTQPVYNEFSDNAIFATYVVAGLSVLSLMTLVGVRIIKTLMKYGRCIDVRPQDLLVCASRFRRGKREPDDVPMAEDDDAIVTDYVHA